MDKNIGLSVPRLNDTNYLVWRRYMHAMLVARDCHKAVDTSETVAAEVSLKAHALITLHVEPHLLHLINVKS